MRCSLSLIVLPLKASFFSKSKNRSQKEIKVKHIYFRILPITSTQPPPLLFHSVSSRLRADRPKQHSTVCLMAGLGHYLPLPGDSGKGLLLQWLPGICPLFPDKRNTHTHKVCISTCCKTVYKVGQSP